MATMREQAVKYLADQGMHPASDGQWYYSNGQPITFGLPVILALFHEHMLEQASAARPKNTPAPASREEHKAAVEEIIKGIESGMPNGYPEIRAYLNEILSRHFPASESVGAACECGDGACIECWPQNFTKEALIEELRKFRGAALQITGEQFLARRGFADSRNYSSTELGPLLEEYARGGTPA